MSDERGHDAQKPRCENARTSGAPISTRSLYTLLYSTLLYLDSGHRPPLIPRANPRVIESELESARTEGRCSSAADEEMESISQWIKSISMLVYVTQRGDGLQMPQWVLIEFEKLKSYCFIRVRLQNSSSANIGGLNTVK